MTNVVQILKDLIQCESITPNEGGALTLIENFLTDRGFECHRLPFGDVDNLFARKGTQSPHFCFAGHTDVVPTGNETKWTHPPFEGVEADGKIYGRGAVDMKGGIAAFLSAIDTIQGDFKGSISLLITGDEEGPAIHGTVKVLKWMAEHGHIPDVCLVGEPTNPNALGDMIKIGRRGSFTASITAKGKQGHVAYPHRAVNPIHTLSKMIDVLTDTPLDDGNDSFQPSSIQFTTIDVGNPATNVIPADAKAVFNIRFNDIHTSQSLEQTLRVRLDELKTPYALSVTETSEAFQTPPSAIATLVQQACQSVVGRKPKFSTSGGTSDARFIKDYCPVAEFGLVGNTMHQVDEHTSVEQLQQLARVYQHLLNSYFEIS